MTIASPHRASPGAPKLFPRADPEYAVFPPRAPEYRFCLYVSGETPNSVQAMANLDAICQDHLAGRCSVEVVDVFREPRRALESSIFMTPTLVRLAPGPTLRIVGTLAPLALVLKSLAVAMDAP